MHRYITENEKKLTGIPLKKIEEWPEDKSPVVTEECVNDELDDDNKNNSIGENETKVNDEDGDDTEVND